MTTATTASVMRNGLRIWIAPLVQVFRDVSARLRENDIISGCVGLPLKGNRGRLRGDGCDREAARDAAEVVKGHCVSHNPKANGDADWQASTPTLVLDVS